MKTTKRNGKLSQSFKLRQIWVRAANKDSRNRWSYTELARWLNSTVEHVKKLIACLNARNQIRSYNDKRSVVFYA